MLFSGHTIVMLVCAYTVRHYLPAKWKVRYIYTVYLKT